MMSSSKHSSFLRLILSVLALTSLCSLIVATPVRNADLSTLEDCSANPLPEPVPEPEALGISFDEGATESVALPAPLDLLKRQG